MTGTTLIVGLGNPGPEYERTRHNIGHMVAGELASRMGAGFTRHRAGALVATGRLGIGGPRVVVAMSTGYMNTSGGPVSALAKFYGLTAAELVVVHDELDIPFDSLRLKRGGGEGGHNGLKSITKSLGTPDYFRVRSGIGRPPGRMDVADFVLRPFTSEEQKTLPLHVDRTADAVEKLLTDGLEAAQTAFH